jgi:REP element-mobilizing transposase RayT
MIRGIEGRSIFLSDRDRTDFLKRLDALVPELGFRCFGWALMPNHVHLAIKSGEIRISRLMARLNTGYARAFNLRHQRQGYLFQNRFRSRIIKSETDLLSVIVYICRNPLNAGIVSSVGELSNWPWSGFSALTGSRNIRPFEAVSTTLAMFGNEPVSALGRLSQLVSRDETQILEVPATDPSSASCRTSSPNEPVLDSLVDNSALVKSGLETSAARLQQIIESVCQQFDVDPSDFHSRRRTDSISNARAVIAYEAVMRHKIPGWQVAKALRVSPSAISHALARGQIAQARNPNQLP